jgi:hypothetical protein
MSGGEEYGKTITSPYGKHAEVVHVLADGIVHVMVPKD